MIKSKIYTKRNVLTIVQIGRRYTGKLFHNFVIIIIIYKTKYHIINLSPINQLEPSSCETAVTNRSCDVMRSESQWYNSKATTTPYNSALQCC